jgi:hypothetical protein
MKRPAGQDVDRPSDKVHHRQPRFVELPDKGEETLQKKRRGINVFR